MVDGNAKIDSDDVLARASERVDAVVRNVNAGVQTYLAAVARCPRLRGQLYPRVSALIEDAGRIFAEIEAGDAPETFKERVLRPRQLRLERLAVVLDGVSEAAPHAERRALDLPPLDAWEVDVADGGARSVRSRWWLAAVVTVVLAVAGCVFWHVRSERAAFRRAMNPPTEESLTGYLVDHSSSKYAGRVLDVYISLMDSVCAAPGVVCQPGEYPPLERMCRLAGTVGVRQEVSARIMREVERHTDSLYARAAGIGTLAAWRDFQTRAPLSMLRDSESRIDSLESLAWCDDSSAWELVCGYGDRDSFRRYIDTFPSGGHVAEAEGRIVDMDVNSYRNHGRSLIDEFTRVADCPDGARVIVFNDTDYAMEFLFSGASSKRMPVAPRARGEVALANGTYRILVLVDDETADRFEFSQQLSDAVYVSSLAVSATGDGD